MAEEADPRREATLEDMEMKRGAPGLIALREMLCGMGCPICGRLRFKTELLSACNLRGGDGIAGLSQVSEVEGLGVL